MATESAGASSDRKPRRRKPSDGPGSSPPLIVGIGASAGGLEAFTKFLANTPDDTGMAFVLVQHLAPDHKSLLAELLGRATRMKVIEAAGGERVRANHVYVIPPDSTLTISGGRLQIAQPAPSRDRRRPIDTFFSSLAEDQGENAVGIILSGTGSDGSLGLATIKEHGGLTLAQAEFGGQAMAGMPQSATATGQVDEVLPVESMPDRLTAYANHLLRVVEHKDGDGTRTDAASRLQTIMSALRARSGHDFSNYKEKTLVRRLQRRMQVLHIDTPEGYIELYRQNPEELDLLFRELLISVTEFFRDPAAFDSLTTVIQDLVAGKGADDDIRVWVPGCATGQEAFSLAILIREAMDGLRVRPKVQVFGTDIDDRAIAVARTGRYRRPLAGLSAERAERWFIDEGGESCVAPEIREMCIFSTHSIIKHPPFSKLDLISCRNLLIYFDATVQDRVMRTFHYALKPGGRLFLGSSESVTRATKLFGVIDKKHRIFSRREVEGPTLPDLSAVGRRLEALAEPGAAPKRPDDKIDRSARRITERYNPPYVVVDARNQIVRFSGPAMGQYVELSSGPSFVLFDILKKSLRPAARAALKASRTDGGVSRHANVPVRVDGQPRLVTITTEPLRDTDQDPGYVAVIFQDGGAGASSGAAGLTDSSEAYRALEEELRTTRTQLQATIDDLETANEELKSTNEEHQSVNEELQSSNEELETSKEEMQSVNEEVQTINAEMSSKNEQLALLNSDLKNLLESTQIATLFLDSQMRVKSFTPAVTEIFHVRETDVGRPIGEVVSLLDYAELEADAKSVLRKLAVVEREVINPSTNTHFTLRIRPYRTVENVIDGVVLTFVDITERQAAAELVRASEARFRMFFEFIDEGFCILEKLPTPPGRPSDYRYLSANGGFAKQTGVVDVVGKTIRQAFPDGDETWFEVFDSVMATGEPIRFEHGLTTDGRTLELFAFTFDDGGNPKLGVIFLDVSHRKRHDEQQELLLREMDHRVKNLFAVVGSMVTLSARSASTPQALAETVLGRLGALASAHRLIRPRGADAHGPRQTTMTNIVRDVLAPHVGLEGSENNSRIAISGPDTPVGADAATSFALVIHELATNATKYGALSAREGHVDLNWRVVEGSFELAGRKAAARPSRPSGARGFRQPPGAAEASTASCLGTWCSNGIRAG